MPMKIVLVEDVEDLGRVGDVVTVKPGYGRNFLIPQGMAAPATKANLAMVSARRKVFEAAAAEVRGKATDLAKRITNLEITIGRKVGDSDNLYGSVTSHDVADALEAHGIVVDKRRVLLADPIKTLGVFEVPIRLHSGVTAAAKVSVVKE